MTLKKSSRAGLLALAFGIIARALSERGDVSTRPTRRRPPRWPRRPRLPPLPRRLLRPPAPTPACANDPDPKKAVLDEVHAQLG